MKRIILLSIALISTAMAHGQWNALPQFTTARLNQVAFCDIHYGWVLGDHFADTTYYIFRTKDGGHTWDSTHFNTMVRKIFLLDQMHGFALTSTLRYTNDGGEHWYSRYLPGEARDIFFVTPDTGWLASDIGLYKTTNAGSTWIPLSGFTGSPVKLCFNNSRQGYVIGYGSSGCVLGRTTDGGTSWGYRDLPEADGFRMFASGVGYLLQYYEHPILGVKSYLMKTLDHGFSWDTLSLPGYNVFDPSDVLNCFFLNENTGWITLLPGNTMVQGIYRTDDGGNNWAFQSLSVPRAISFVNRDFGWCVGAPSHIAMHTINGGGGPIGIAEIEGDPLGLKVWPNPCNDRVWFQCGLQRPELLTVRIIDMTGKSFSLSTRLAWDSGQSGMELSLPDLPPGIFLLEVTSKSGSSRCKILKM
ncbi:MAG TPA: YCF48-related protein [Bacteroidales bacterium]|nr:YCF48-related protein [Bacteroidales bacterium]HRZ75831.1 YCF48-related protein [Bacteroidales bacterium]